MTQTGSNTTKQNQKTSTTKDRLETLRDKGSEVLATVAAMQEVATRIEAAVLEFENKKLEVIAAIELERTASINQILSERQKSLKQIADARDGAIKAFKAAQGSKPVDAQEFQNPHQLAVEQN